MVRSTRNSARATTPPPQSSNAEPTTASRRVLRSHTKSAVNDPASVSGQLISPTKTSSRKSRAGPTTADDAVLIALSPNKQYAASSTPNLRSNEIPESTSPSKRRSRKSEATTKKQKVSKTPTRKDGVIEYDDGKHSPSEKYTKENVHIKLSPTKASPTKTRSTRSSPRKSMSPVKKRSSLRKSGGASESVVLTERDPETKSEMSVNKDTEKFAEKLTAELTEDAVTEMQESCSITKEKVSTESDLQNSTVNESVSNSQEIVSEETVSEGHLATASADSESMADPGILLSKQMILRPPTDDAQSNRQQIDPDESVVSDVPGAYIDPTLVLNFSNSEPGSPIRAAMSPKPLGQESFDQSLTYTEQLFNYSSASPVPISTSLIDPSLLSSPPVSPNKGLDFFFACIAPRDLTLSFLAAEVNPFPIPEVSTTPTVEHLSQNLPESSPEGKSFITQ